jgi:hypothetical protein
LWIELAIDNCGKRIDEYLAVGEWQKYSVFDWADPGQGRKILGQSSRYDRRFVCRWWPSVDSGSAYFWTSVFEALDYWNSLRLEWWLCLQEQMPPNSCVAIICATCRFTLLNHDTWSLTLRHEHKWKGVENRTLRRTLSTRWDDVTGDWLQLHNEELRNPYSSRYIELMWQNEGE